YPLRRDGWPHVVRCGRAPWLSPPRFRNRRAMRAGLFPQLRCCAERGIVGPAVPRHGCRVGNTTDAAGTGSCAAQVVLDGVRGSASGVLSPRGRQILFTLPALRGFGEHERDRIANLFTEIARTKGETIYEAGDEAEALYVVVSGAVDVLDGKRAI